MIEEGLKFCREMQNQTLPNNLPADLSPELFTERCTKMQDMLTEYTRTKLAFEIDWTKLGLENNNNNAIQGLDQFENAHP